MKDKPITLYGISNCDTVRKARKWLDDHDIVYTFHDFRKDGLDAASVRSWATALGWENLLNRRGTTWRKLPESARSALDETQAIALMITHPALIKRPVIEAGKAHWAGFDQDTYERLLIRNR